MSREDGILHLHEVTIEVEVKIWAYDEQDAKELVSSTSQWDDWNLNQVLSLKDTGKTDTV